MPVSNLSREEELAVVLEARAGSEAAMVRLLDAHEMILRQFTYRYMSSSSTSYTDGLQEAREGFIYGVRKFDPDRGNRLWSYVQWWVRARLIESSWCARSVVKRPTRRGFQQAAFKLGRTETVLGPDVDADELAAAMGGNVEAEHVRLAEIFLTTDDERAEWVLEGAGDAKSDEDELIAQIDNRRLAVETLSACRRVLNARERKIVFERVLQDPRRTLKEIGDELGLTRERVRQIEDAAFAKVRAEMRRGRLRADAAE